MDTSQKILWMMFKKDLNLFWLNFIFFCIWILLVSSWLVWLLTFTLPHEVNSKNMHKAIIDLFIFDRNKIMIMEVPINYHRRLGQSKLRTFADGWRHLRFMLLYSPMILFFAPGLILFLVGIISFGLLWHFGFLLWPIRYWRLLGLLEYLPWRALVEDLFSDRLLTMSASKLRWDTRA